MHMVTKRGVLGSLGRGIPEFPVAMEKIESLKEEGWLDGRGLASAGNQKTLKAVKPSLREFLRTQNLHHSMKS